MTREGAGVTGSGSGMTGLGVGWERYRIRLQGDNGPGARVGAALRPRLPGRRNRDQRVAPTRVHQAPLREIATRGSLLLEFIKPHDEKSRPEGRSHLNSSRPSPYCLSSRPQRSLFSSSWPERRPFSSSRPQRPHSRHPGRSEA